MGYTTRGQLLGHVAIGLEILEKHLGRFPDLRPEIRTILQHLIISHHGEVEKGALRLPMFPEAIVLHYLDELDARLEQTWRIIDQTPAGEELTAYAPSLERQLYRGPLGEGRGHCREGRQVVRMIVRRSPAAFLPCVRGRS